MPIRARFLITTLSFLGLLASGAFAPSAAGSYVQDPGPLEFAALPPQLEEQPRPGVLVEPVIDSPGSGVESATSGEIPEADAWAEAFAESARHQAVVAAVQTPALYPVELNAQVEYFLDRFTGSRRAVIEAWMGRSGKYLGMIQQVLSGQGLPADLAFTVMIESGFNPLAVSRAGAKGLWQFMATTARRYGLRVDKWVDERLDAERSTVAAAAYLRDLYAQFGSWTLAQAAYNAGELTVARAIRATGSSDFWVLNRTRFLRRETQEFVPAIQAATLIGRDPERYGFETGEPGGSEDEFVTVPASTDLRRLAVKAGLSLDRLRSLNPVLVRGVTPPGRTWELRVPVGTRDGVVAMLAPRRLVVVAKGAPARNSAKSEIHVVRPRDTVASIAKRYGVSVVEVLRWNRLEEEEPIHPGDRLRVAELR